MQNQSLVINTQAGATMSSLDFLANIINPARAQFGESEHEPRHFLAKVEDELDLCATVKKFRLNSNQSKSYFYELTTDQMMLVGMRESKAVRKKVLDVLNKNASPALPNNFAEALRLAADQAEQIQQLQITNQHSSMKIDVLEQLLAAGVSAPEFCRRLNGVNTMKVNDFLLDAGWLILATGSKVRWRVASYARDKYMTEKAFEVTPKAGESFTVNNPVLLKAGAKRLVALYMASKLPMKKTWNKELKHDLAGVLEVVQ